MAEHLISKKHSITNIYDNLDILEINKNNHELNNLEKYIYKYNKKYRLINHQTTFECDDLFHLV